MTYIFSEQLFLTSETILVSWYENLEFFQKNISLRESIDIIKLNQIKQ